jgi:hypothetical protein
MDCKERYNQTVFLETIKMGREPKRSGLGYRLYLLAGFTTAITSISKKNIKLKKYNFYKLEKVSVNKTTNRIEFYRHFYDPFSTNLVLDLKSEQMQKTLKKYLGTYLLEFRGAYAYVYYKPDVVINWGELDEDLKNKYPTKCRIDKRGFVYYKHK